MESASLISDSDGNEIDEARPVACGSPWGCIIMEQDSYDSGFSKWIDYSKYTLNKVANAGGKVLFDLSNISNINDEL